MTHTWTPAITHHLDWLAASGASTGTLKLRRHYLRRLATLTPDPWTATTDEINRFLAHPGWAPETRHSARATICVFYRWALDTDRVAKDPTRNVPTVRVPPAVPRPCPEYVVASALLRADHRGRSMIVLAAFAGLRRGEIAALHTRDIGPTSLRVKGKGGKTRVVPVHHVVADVLRGLPTGYVFPGQVNGHLSPDRVGHILVDLLGPGWSAHTLRHRFASLAYLPDRDLRAVQELLGHSKPETTARYTAVPDGALRSAVLSISLPQAA